MSANITILDSGNWYTPLQESQIAADAVTAFQMWQNVLAPSSANIEITIDFTTGVVRGDGASTTTQFIETVGGFDIYDQGAGYEMLTGNDPNGATSDITIHLNPNFQAQYYWIDPQDGTPLPANKNDLIDVLAHEMGHALAFNGWKDWATYKLPSNYESFFDALISVVNGQPYFVGAHAEALYGGPVPLTAGNVDHVGNASPAPGADLIPDLMNGVVFNYMRYGISALDVAILSDVGLATSLGDNLLGGSLGDNMNGGGGDDFIHGQAGNDVLNGGIGQDTLYGGTGDDIYYVDSSNDVVTELVGEGTDTVYATASFTLSNNVENLVLQGTADISGTGNGGDNYIQGNSGANVLEGGAGNDNLQGMDGNDTASYAGSANAVAVNLNLQGQWQNTFGAGNDYLSSIENVTGSIFGDILTGDGNANVLTGLGGDDIYYAGTGDTVVEAVGSGIDTVYASVNFTLLPNIENLVLQGTSNIDGTGNAGDNYIQGNSGNNVLEGGAGNDGLWAGAGNDTASYAHAAFAVAIDLNLQDQWQNTFGAGNDYLSSIENVTGSAFGDILTGDSQVNILTGLNGDDVYHVGAGDIVVEAASGGTDSVYAGVSSSLADNVENLVLQGNVDINGTGNGLDNYIEGNSANNVLEGGLGNDGLHGGGGSDTASYAHSGYAVAVSLNQQDQWQNTFGAGIDYLSSIENLTGSAFDDILTGDNNANALTGNGGNDLITGGLGADRFMFAAAGAANGQDWITDFISGTDKLVFAASDYGFAGPHNLASDELVAGTIATAGHDQFLFDAASHSLFWDADGTSQGTAVRIAGLEGVNALSSGDFLFL